MDGALFAIIAYDKSGSQQARIEHRDGHLAHFNAHADRIAVAGPMSGSQSGSLVVYCADSEDEARYFIEMDPFFSAGVWARIEVMSFKAASGVWAE
ncbi:MAG: YciI family protein [Pseudomonadota bacterium]